MSLYAIADLHLANAVSDKSMDVFGKQWTDHQKKIEENWREMVTDHDVVLIPGDISWAMKLEDAIADLNWIHSLPGKKLLIRGNHDFWWGSIGKVRRALPESIRAIQNDCYDCGDYVVTGTRGWITADNTGFTKEDEKIYSRELIRMRLGLDEAKKKNKSIILMMHFPPYSEKGFENGFIELIENYGVKRVCYGHLHGKSVYKGFNGMRNGVEYTLVSSDAIQFKPIFIQ